MNKILLNSEDELNDLVIENDTDMIINFDDVDKRVNIIVESGMCLNLLEFNTNTKVNLSITLKENSRLIYNRAVKNSIDHISIMLNGLSSSAVICNSVSNDIDGSVKFELIHNNADTYSELHNHGINNSKEGLKLYVDAIINSSAVNSVTKQENKIINTNSGESNIYPNLLVNIDEVDASHSAYIGDFDKEAIFYMKSRGLDEKTSRKLLIDAFLIGNLNIQENYLEKAKEVLF